RSLEMTTSTKPAALITGASRGIGASVAQRLAREGFHVLLNYSSNEAKARTVLDGILSQGGTGELCGFDVSDSAQVEEKFKGIGEKFGALGALVNNAGITIDGLLIRMKDDDLEKTLAV